MDNVKEQCDKIIIGLNYCLFSESAGINRLYFKIKITIIIINS